MLIISDEEWGYYRIPNAMHRFFVMLWDELFDDRTPDTWRIRTTNILGVLEELVEAIDVAEEHEQSQRNIPVLLDEARSMIQVDPVIPRHFPFLTDYLPKSSTAADSTTAPTSGGDAPTNSVIDLRELRKRVNVMIGQLQDYPTFAIADLRAALAQADSKRKEDIYRLTMAVAVEWSVMGYCHEHLADITQLLDSSEDDFIRRFDQFATRFDGSKQLFTCRFGLNWPSQIPIATFRIPDIQLTQGLPPHPLNADESRFYGKAATNDVFADVLVEALDPITAYRAAQAKIINVLAALNLYFVQYRLEIKGSVVLVTSDRHTTLVRVERTREFPTYHESSVSAVRVEAFLRLLQRGQLSTEDADQMAAALQYHRLALSASTDESRLVNLWIALECLTRREQTTIIGAVGRNIAPSAATTNIRRIVESLLIYISSFLRFSNQSVPQNIFPRSASDSLAAADLLDSLLDIEDGPKITALYDLVGMHELLRYRVFRIRKKTLASGSDAAKTMGKHLQNIEWQLRRIYRARNHITHRGRGNASLPHMIRHLHSYFHEAFNNLVTDLDKNTRWSIRDAFEHRRLLFSHYVNAIDGKGKQPIDKPGLLDPNRVLFAMSKDSAWPTTPQQASSSRDSAGKTQVKAMTSTETR